MILWTCGIEDVHLCISENFCSTKKATENIILCNTYLIVVLLHLRVGGGVLPDNIIKSMMLST